MGRAADERYDLVVVSGYFAPLHVGHVRLIRAAATLGSRVVVIVNNDAQQELKKGRVVIPVDERAEVVRALGDVDDVLIAVDQDRSINASLAEVRRRHPTASIAFANGGDVSDVGLVLEAAVCQELGIDLLVGVGGEDKADSSSRLIEETGL